MQDSVNQFFTVNQAVPYVLTFKVILILQVVEVTPVAFKPYTDKTAQL